MSLAFNDLERILLNEQKKCDDHLIMGGLEQLVNKWASQQSREGDSDHARSAEEVMSALKGYTDAATDARKQMIDQALVALHAAPRAEAAPVIEPETISAPPEPPDEFDEDEETAPAASPVQRANVSQGFGLDASVTRLQNVGPAFAKKLERLGIYTVSDLLYHYPRRYDDYSKLKTISQLMYGEEVTLLLTVGEANTREARGNLTITNVLLADPTGTIQVTFFNQPYLQQQFKSGRRIVISGTVDQHLGHLTLK